jgi:hypothetical protein
MYSLSIVILLKGYQAYFARAQVVGKRAKVGRTAMPANAPAAMFCSKEKLGGRDS